MNTEQENQEVPKWFATHPLAAAFKQEQAAETLKHRQEAAEKLEAVNAEIAAGFPESEAALCSVLEDLKQTEKRLADLRREAGQAYRDLRIAKNDLERRRAAVETELYSTYDPRIDEAQAFFRNKIDDLRRPGTIDTRPMGAARDVLRQSKTVKMENNFEAVEAAMAFCRDAIEKLEAWKLIPEYPAQEVEKLKEEIPAIDRYVEYCAERPMPKDAPLGAGAPSDYEIKKLLGRRI